MNSTKTVKTSSRPMSMSKARNIFAKSFRCAKLYAGPTLPNPGPTLLIQVITALHEVLISSVKNDITMLPIVNIIIKSTKNAITLVMIFGCTLFELYFTFITALGCIVRLSSVKEFLNNKSMRTTLTPPEVDPADEPMNMSRKRISPSSAGQSK